MFIKAGISLASQGDVGVTGTVMVSTLRIRPGTSTKHELLRLELKGRNSLTAFVDWGHITHTEQWVT